MGLGSELGFVLAVCSFSPAARRFGQWTYRWCMCESGVSSSCSAVGETAREAPAGPPSPPAVAPLLALAVMLSRRGFSVARLATRWPMQK